MKSSRANMNFSKTLQSILMAMDHPNIIRFHDVCVGEEHIFIIMDLAANGDLFSFVANCGPLPEWRARSYFSQLADAVTYCHSRGVYHRDLKPENILLTDEYRTLEVADFGFAAVIDKHYDVHPLLRTNCGSPHYCAPEVWNNERKGGYDGSKADAFSCGVILYCMLVGAQPFHDSSVDLILAKVNRCEFDVPATVSAAACDLVEGLLRRDPNCRINLTQAMLHPWTSGKALAKPELLKTTLHEARGGILGSCSGTAK